MIPTSTSEPGARGRDGRAGGRLIEREEKRRRVFEAMPHLRSRRIVRSEESAYQNWSLSERCRLCVCDGGGADCASRFSCCCRHLAQFLFTEGPRGSHRTTTSLLDQTPSSGALHAADRQRFVLGHRMGQCPRKPVAMSRPTRGYAHSITGNLTSRRQRRHRARVVLASRQGQMKWCVL